VLAGALVLEGGSSPPFAEATIALWDEARVHFGTRNAGQYFRELRGRRNLKLHLGCGTDIRQGWVNIDAFIPTKRLQNSQANTFAIKYDLRRPIPLENSCSSYIYSSHFFEHLRVDDGYQLMQECFRLLAARGVFRIALPDFRRAFIAYINSDLDYFRVLEDSKAIPKHLADAQGLALSKYINYVVYQEGEHKCVMDPEIVINLLQSMGYTKVHQVDFDPSVDVDNDLRKKYSFYVEAEK